MTAFIALCGKSRQKGVVVTSHALHRNSFDTLFKDKTGKGDYYLSRALYNNLTLPNLF